MSSGGIYGSATSDPCLRGRWLATMMRWRTRRIPTRTGCDSSRDPNRLLQSEHVLVMTWPPKPFCGTCSRVFGSFTQQMGHTGKLTWGIAVIKSLRTVFASTAGTCPIIWRPRGLLISTRWSRGSPLAPAAPRPSDDSIAHCSAGDPLAGSFSTPVMATASNNWLGVAKRGDRSLVRVGSKVCQSTRPGSATSGQPPCTPHRRPVVSLEEAFAANSEPTTTKGSIVPQGDPLAVMPKEVRLSRSRSP